jgi:hypothetical protein
MTQQYGPTPEGWGPQGGPPPTPVPTKRTWLVRHKIVSAAATVVLLLFAISLVNGPTPTPVGVSTPAVSTTAATRSTTTIPVTTAAPTTTTVRVLPTTVAPTTTVSSPTTRAPALEPAPAPPATPVTPAPTGCGADSYVNSSGACILRPYAAPAPPAGATAMCNDGTYSFSAHHSGSCSHHGGVAIFYS